MSKPKQYWLIKQEPTSYAWETFVKDGGTAWTGVRNFQARNNLQAMKVGDRALYYHSVVGKEAAGIAEVKREAYPDATAKDGAWVCVDFVPVAELARPISLEEIKTVPALKDMVLLKNSRLSVQPVTKPEFDTILQLAKTKTARD